MLRCSLRGLWLCTQFKEESFLSFLATFVEMKESPLVSVPHPDMFSVELQTFE